MFRYGKRSRTYVTAAFVALWASVCGTGLSAADENAVGHAYPPFSFKFFEPNESCQYDKIEFVFKDGTARVVLWELGKSGGKLKHMSGKPDPERGGMTFVYGRTGCQIGVSLSDQAMISWGGWFSAASVSCSTVEEGFAGPALDAGALHDYPVVRRGLPIVRAAKRYLSCGAQRPLHAR